MLAHSFILADETFHSSHCAFLFMKKSYRYSDADRAAIYRVMSERRDMRHFNGQTIDGSIIRNILSAAHMAPSVGLMQPWRFICIKQQALREQIHRLVDEERIRTAEALGKRKEEFMALKVEGVLQCSDLIVAALPDKRDQHVFGRRTLPEMDLASLSCAIQNMWLAARAEGVGMGWVSIFDPEALKHILKMPEDSHPIAVLCLGEVDEFYPEPMLVTEGWREQDALEDLIYEDQWGDR